MAREVVWTIPAWDDIEGIAEYIARDSESYAAVLVQDLRDAAESLAEMADRGQIVPEFGDPVIRELLVSPYRVLYQVDPDRVTILAIVHGARRSRRS